MLVIHSATHQNIYHLNLFGKARGCRGGTPYIFANLQEPNGTDASIDASSQNIFTKTNRMIQSYLVLRKTLCIDIRRENLDIC